MSFLSLNRRVDQWLLPIPPLPHIHPIHHHRRLLLRLQRASSALCAFASAVSFSFESIQGSPPLRWSFTASLWAIIAIKRSSYLVEQLMSTRRESYTYVYIRKNKPRNLPFL
jgi:hypothetical protein